MINAEYKDNMMNMKIGGDVVDLVLEYVMVRRHIVDEVLQTEFGRDIANALVAELDKISVSGSNYQEMLTEALNVIKVTCGAFESLHEGLGIDVHEKPATEGEKEKLKCQ